MAAKRLQPYPPVSASTAQLGYNSNSDISNAALDAIKAGGATIVRYQPAWQSVEDYTTGNLALTGAQETFLARCASIGLQPMLIAAYGPPWTALATLTLTAQAVSGDTVLHVSGALGSIDVPFCHVNDAADAALNNLNSGKWAYYGQFITAVNVGGGTITLASTINRTLANGSQLHVNRLRYASLPTTDPTEAGVTAYLRYAAFLAQRIAANGATGYVYLWNEVPWPHDQWDARGRFYDSPPGGVTTSGQFTGMLTAARAVTLPSGVKFVNGLSDKTGDNGVMLNGTPQPTVPQLAPFAGDAIHPYGDRPEQSSWDNTSTADDTFGSTWYEIVHPADRGANWAHMAKANADYKVTNGVTAGLFAGECGMTTANDTRQAVYLLRRVASLWGMGAIPVVYTFADDPTFGVVAAGTYAARTSYTALARLMTMVTAVGTIGVSSARSVPSLIASPDSRYPPMIVGVYGAAGGLLLAWQRTQPVAAATWATVSAPATINVQFQLGAGYAIAEAKDLLTGSTIVPTVAGSVMTLAIGETVQAVRTAPA